MTNMAEVFCPDEPNNKIVVALGRRCKRESTDRREIVRSNSWNLYDRRDRRVPDGADQADSPKRRGGRFDRDAELF